MAARKLNKTEARRGYYSNPRKRNVQLLIAIGLVLCIAGTAVVLAQRKRTGSNELRKLRPSHRTDSLNRIVTIDVIANPAYGYDPAGNLTKQQGGSTSDTMVYDAENRQIRFTSGQTGAITAYEYDGDGRRVKKVSGSVTTLFVHNVLGQLVAEYDNAASSSGGGTSYLMQDHLGSTRIVTDSGGNVKARHDYLPFGDEILANVGGRSSIPGYTANDPTKQRFTGKERDGESGLDLADRIPAQWQSWN